MQIRWDIKENPMKPIIKHQDLDAEFHTSEGCYIIEQSNSPDDPELSIARAKVAPGTTTRLHRLNRTTERYCIVSGTGIVEVGDLPPTKVAAGDIVIIPPMCLQCITNTGTADLIFLAICTPRYCDDVYEDIEESPE